MVKVLALAALLAFVYSVLMVLYSASRKPLTVSHGEQIARAQARWTVIMVMAALLLGLSLDKLLP